MRSALASSLVPDLLRQFRSEAPRVQFDLPARAQVTKSPIFSRLGKLTSPSLVPHPDRDQFGWHALTTLRLCLAVPHDHPFAHRRRMSLGEAADESFIIATDPFMLRAVTHELSAAEGISPPIAFEATWLPTMEGLVAAGLGVR